LPSIPRRTKSLSPVRPMANLGGPYLIVLDILKFPVVLVGTCLVEGVLVKNDLT
jgi:hypothetical protein